MTAVYLDEDYFADPRFAFAAQLLGVPRGVVCDAVQRCWHFCYTNQTPDLDVTDIRIYTGWTGAAASLIDALVEARICDKNVDGTIRFRGTSQRIALIRRGLERAVQAGKRGAAMRWRDKTPTLPHLPKTSNPIGSASSPHSHPTSDNGHPIATLRRTIGSDGYLPTDLPTDLKTEIVIDPVSDDTGPVATADAADDSRTRLPVRSLAKLWNQHRHPGMPEVDPSKLSSASPRYRFARQRLVEQPDLAYWRQVIERIAASSFCRGENNRGWRADFAFLVRAETHVKVLEGKYDDRGASNGAAADTAKKAEVERRLAAIFGEEGADAAQ